MRRKASIAVGCVALVLAVLAADACLCSLPAVEPESAPPGLPGAEPESALPGGGARAHLWIDPDGGTCTRQATPAPYSDVSACATFQAAYEAASLGDTVKIVAGSYGEQPMNFVPDKASTSDQPDVTFISEAGSAAEVTVASITGSGIRHVTFDSITVTEGVTLECEDNAVPLVARGHHPVDVTLTSSQVGTTRSENASMLTIARNTIGPSSAVIKVGGSADIGGGNCTDEPPIDIVFEDNDIHNFREASADAHMECVFVEGTQGFTFRRNRVRGCSVFGLFFKQQLSAGEFGMSNILIENNMIGHPVASAFRSAGSTAVSFSGDGSTEYRNLTVRHNSINAAVLVRDDLGVTFTRTVFQGNLMTARGGSCSAGAWTGNAYLSSSQKCPGDVADGVRSGWLDVETQEEIDSPTSDPKIDYHLEVGAWAIGQATTTAADDYDGEVRPVGGSYDVGCDERS